MERIGALGKSRGYYGGKKSYEREMGSCGGHETNNSVAYSANDLLYLSLTCHEGFIILTNVERLYSGEQITDLLRGFTVRGPVIFFLSVQSTSLSLSLAPNH